MSVFYDSPDVFAGIFGGGGHNSYRGCILTARRDLENALGGPPLTATELMTDRECADLLALFTHARTEEVKGLSQSVDAMIGELPRPLRTPAKKIMFGKLLDR